MYYNHKQLIISTLRNIDMKKQILFLLLLSTGLTHNAQACQGKTARIRHSGLTRDNFLEEKSEALIQALKDVKKQIGIKASEDLFTPSEKIENNIIQAHIDLVQNSENEEGSVNLQQHHAEHDEIWGRSRSLHAQAHLDQLLLQNELAKTQLKLVLQKN